LTKDARKYVPSFILADVIFIFTLSRNNEKSTRFCDAQNFELGNQVLTPEKREYHCWDYRWLSGENIRCSNWSANSVQSYLITLGHADGKYFPRGLGYFTDGKCPPDSFPQRIVRRSFAVGDLSVTYFLSAKTRFINFPLSHDNPKITTLTNMELGTFPLSSFTNLPYKCYESSIASYAEI